MNPSEDLIAIDFFCGAGGVTRGLRNAGIRVVKGIDIDQTMKDTYEKNNSGSIFLAADIQAVSKRKVMDRVNRENKKLIFVGCAPCQPFSQINKNGKNKKRDNRRPLILFFFNLVRKIKPEYLFIENVPYFGKKNNKYFGQFERLLKKAGYSIASGVVDAKVYGVPQTRKRFILLGSLNGPISFPPKTHGPGLEPYVTVKDILDRYPPIKAGQKHESIMNHVAANLSERNLSRLKKIKRNGGSRTDLPSDLELECHKKHRGHTDVYGRMAWNKPAPTLTCKCTSISNGRFAHPVQNRGISVREAAALQTFPDDYVFHATKTHAAKQVGNAVPVVLAQRIGEQFIKVCSKGDFPSDSVTGTFNTSVKTRD